MDRISLGKEHREPDYRAMDDIPAGPLSFLLIMYFLADGAAALVIHSRNPSDAAEIFVIAVVASQAMLLTYWLGLGNARLLVRLTLALAWLVWMMWLIVPQREWNRETIAGMSLFLLVAAAPYGLSKLLGFRLVRYEFRRGVDLAYRNTRLDFDRLPYPVPDRRVDKNERAESGSRIMVPPLRGSRFQFSIVQVFGWMVLAGVMATLARLAQMPLDAVWPMTVAISIFTAFGLVILWAVLRGEIVGGRLFAPLALVVITSVVMAVFFRAGEAFRYIFSTLLIATSLVALVLGVFRSAGYRMRRVAETPGDGTDYDNTKSQSAADPWSEEANEVKSPS